MKNKVQAKEIPRPIVSFDCNKQEEIFNRVVNLAADLGVQIVCDKDAPVDAGCPFSIVIEGIKWGRLPKPSQIILNRNEFFAVHGLIPILAGEIIHELGHVISKSTTKPEIDFFGWEFAVASRYGLEDYWFLSSANYCIDEYGTEFGRLGIDDQSDIIEESLILSTKKKFIVNGIPKGLSE